MNEANLTKEQQEVVDKFEFHLSLLKDQDLLYSSFRTFIREIPNNYDLGATVRKLFSE